MKIDSHSVCLMTPPLVSAQTRAAQNGSAASTRSTASPSPFAALVGGLPAAAGAGRATSANPLASWVTCQAPAGSVLATPAASAATATGTASSAAPLLVRNTKTPPPSMPTTAGSAGAISTQVATPVSSTVAVQPGIGALISAIQSGSIQPTYLSPSQLTENTQFGTVTDSSAYYASDATAQQLATLLGGTVVKQVPFPSSTATSTEPKANFIQLPSGQTVNAADLAYYAKFSGYGTQQLAADLTQEINQGGAITSYNKQLLAYLSGNGNYPSQIPMFQPDVIGPAIAGMTYPPGTLNADGSVYNPATQQSVGS